MYLFLIVVEIFGRVRVIAGLQRWMDDPGLEVDDSPRASLSPWRGSVHSNYYERIRVRFLVLIEEIETIKS